MKLLSDQTCQAWISGVEQRLRRFFTDDFFELTRTADRDWWASVIEDAAETAQTITICWMVP